MRIKGLTIMDWIRLGMLDLETSIKCSSIDYVIHPLPNAKSREAGSEENKSLFKACSDRTDLQTETVGDSKNNFVVEKLSEEDNSVFDEDHKNVTKNGKDLISIDLIPIFSEKGCEYVTQENYVAIMKNMLASENVSEEVITESISKTIAKMIEDTFAKVLENEKISEEKTLEYTKQLTSILYSSIFGIDKDTEENISKDPVTTDTKEENSAAFSDTPFGVKDEDPLDDPFGNEIIKKMIEEIMKEKSRGLTPDQYQAISNDPVNPYIAFQNTMEEMQRNAVRAAQNQQQYEYVQTNNPGAAPKKERPIIPKAGGFAVDAPIKKYPPKAEGDDIKADVPIPVVTEPTPIEKESAIIIPPAPLPPAPKQEPDKPRFDNSAIIEKYPYMGKIEEIALKNGIQIDMRFNKGDIKNNNGIILVFAYNGSKVEMEKSFSIDTGVMIDRRVKFYPMACEYGFENINPYYMTDKPPKDKKTKTNGPILKEKMFDDWFKGGEMNLSVGKMYSEDDFELNKLVAMITLPKRDIGNNKEVEEAIRTRLTNAMKAGYLQDILQNIPYGRFKFKEDSVFGTIDKHSKKPITNFTITTENVPQFYAGPFNSRDESIRILGCNRVAEMMFNKDGEAVYSLIDKK